MAAGKETNPNLPKHFYETITNPPDHPIRISTLFMKRYGESLGESVILTAGGTDWKVWLKNINGGTWLEKGWRGFVEYYSIKDEYLVAFKYLGNSRFLVTVFDQSCSEIVCPEPYPQLVPVKVEPAENETAIVGNRGAVRPNLGISYSVVNGRRLRKRVSGKFPDGSCGENPTTPLQSLNLRKRVSGRVSVGRPGAKPTKRTRLGNEIKTQKILALEREFKSKYPFYVCSMKRSYVSGRYSAGIPVIFLEKHFTLDEIEKGMKFSVRLSGEKKKWPVVVKGCRGHGTALRGRGWKYFVQQHALKVGEICIFELIKKEQILDFHVFE